jgi:aryl-alcohol dehydrogenase-like predicted oxidoreductase
MMRQQAFAAGVNLFDNAEAYSKGEAEKIMGSAISQGIKDGVWTRSDIVVTTKLFFGTGGTSHNSRGCSRKHIVEGLQASLERMKLAHVDVVFFVTDRMTSPRSKKLCVP